MKVLFDCFPCMLRQSLEASRMATDDTRMQETILFRTMELLRGYEKYRNSPDMVRDIHRIVRELTGNQDLYREIKEKDLTAALSLYPFLKEFLHQKDYSLYWALKIAATGNNLDAAIYGEIDLKQCVERELDLAFAVCDLAVFEEKLKTAKKILIVGDNTGETVFDKVMLEQLSGMEIVYAVRSEAILNDVTQKEAIASGLDQVSRIVSTGCNAPGAILADCSEEFVDIYRNADIIISKGQGNFEALSEEPGHVFFLLKAKCPMIAAKLNVNLNDYVFQYTNGLRN